MLYPGAKANVSLDYLASVSVSFSHLERRSLAANQLSQDNLGVVVFEDAEKSNQMRIISRLPG